ncbi:MAG: hypothetical protein AAF486_08275 [Pseudomonadota bacterium]
MNVTRASLYAGVAAVSLTAGAGWAGGHLAFAPGEGDFNTKRLHKHAFAANLGGERISGRRSPTWLLQQNNSRGI